MRTPSSLAALLLAWAVTLGSAVAAPSAAGAAASGPVAETAWAPATERLGAVRPLGDGYTVRHEVLRLPNGFQAILVEDHRLPLVAFDLWVHAGPRNEAAGQTGFAHLFEHLMFAGTRHIPRGEADRLVDAAGGTDYNGSTNFDRTNYYFTLPSNQLELGLWIKSDMLGYMIDEVDPVALATQQDVVRNERRQTTENRPYGVADEAVYHALYPPGHPYRAAVIGSHADIQSIRLDDVRAFARTYYRPNNATLVLAGDFEPARAKALLRKYFGSLRPGAPVPPVALAPEVADVAITAERRVVVPDRVELPRLTLAWHSAPAYAPGDAELQLAAAVLGGDKSSRLYRKLVYERQIAQSVTAAQSGQALGSVFSIEVVARPGHTLDEIQAAVDEELDALAATPPSEAELQRARRAVETQLFGRLETVGGIADLLNEYNQLAGDIDYLPRDLARFRAVTPEALRQAVARTLPRSARVAVLAQPGEQVLPPDVPAPPLPESAKKAAGHGQAINADEPWRRRRPPAGPARPLTLPAGDRYTLANGLTVVRVARPGVPLVSAALVLRAGQDANPPERPGLAGFTAALLEDGTETRSATAFAEQVADLGATLTAKAGREDARLEFAGLRSGLAQGLGLVADAARHPAFDAAEIERRRAARHAALLQQREDARATAATVAQRAWYGEGHPLGASPLGDEASLAATTRDDLRRFWRSRYRPDRAALVVAGDVGADELRALAERLFGDWAPDAAAAAAPQRLAAPRPTAARLVLVDKPGTPQTALALIGPGPRAADPQRGATEVMNAALGGLFTSRINQQLREAKGYTYGMFSGYTEGRDDGLFAVRGSVRTPVTGAALGDLYKELDAIRARPLGAEELARARNAKLRSLPGEFDTNRAVADAYADAWAAGLPPDHVVRLPSRYAAVTGASAFAAARAHVEPARIVTVAVGDRAQIGAQLERLGRGPVELRDADGRPLPAGAESPASATPGAAPAAGASAPAARTP